MSLRQAVKNATNGPEGDIEALTVEGAHAKCSTFAPCVADHNHKAFVFPAKAIYRRVFGLLASASGSPPRCHCAARITRKGLLLLGLALGALSLSLHRCGGRCRSAALRLLHDPDARATLNAASERTYLTAAEYAAARREIDHVPEHAASGDEVLRKIAHNGEKEQEELVSVRAEYARALGFAAESFCGTCHWGWAEGGVSLSCGERLVFLTEKYSTGRLASKTQVMARPSCVTTGQAK